MPVQKIRLEIVSIIAAKVLTASEARIRLRSIDESVQLLIEVSPVNARSQRPCILIWGWCIIICNGSHSCCYWSLRATNHSCWSCITLIISSLNLIVGLQTNIEVLMIHFFIFLLFLFCPDFIVFRILHSIVLADDLTTFFKYSLWFKNTILSIFAQKGLTT